MLRHVAATGDEVMDEADFTRRSFAAAGLATVGAMSFNEAQTAAAAQSATSVQHVEVKRVRVASRRSFDEVRERLHQAVPRSTPVEQYPEAMAKAGGVNREGFESVVRAHLGERGFTLFGELDYGQWLPFYGVKKKAVRWIVGNPLIALTMLRHDINAALFAPVELLLVEDETRSGTVVIYDLPSSLMVTGENPPLLAAAQALDAKLHDLVADVTDA
jgi:uncharacterized protein (DUF302 family)